MRSLANTAARSRAARYLLLAAIGCFGLMIQPAEAAIAAQPALDSGATAWVLTASALVLFMTLPGLALFYGGLGRDRTLLRVLVRCFAISCVVSLVWLAFGYSLVFAPGNGMIGSFDAAFLTGIREHLMPNGLPTGAFALFQLTFAIITPALIIGAITERAPFGFVILFSAIWTALVYVPVAHWVWGGGWLARAGTIDFAGGIVVHATAGVSALVAAWLVGPREGFPKRIAPPHNLTMAMAGAGMLWVGWFGFNGGSALAANGSAASAILATQFAAAAAGLAWITIERWRLGAPTALGIVSGSIAGLATITPASGYVGPIGAAVIGAAGGIVCCFAIGPVKNRLRIDDSLDVFATHGVGGMLGSLLVAVFALPALGGSGYGHAMSVAGQIGAQAIGIAGAVVWSAVCTFVIVKVLAATIGTRVNLEEDLEFGDDGHGDGVRAAGELSFDAQFVLSPPNNGTIMIRDYSDHAANERTFLAWVRTGIAVAAFGFVIEKFNLFVATIASSALGEAAHRAPFERLAGPFGHYDGFALIVGGVAVIVLATVRFARTTSLLDDYEEHSAKGVRAELILSAGLVLLIAAYSVYLAIT